MVHFFWLIVSATNWAARHTSTLFKEMVRQNACNHNMQTWRLDLPASCMGRGVAKRAGLLGRVRRHRSMGKIWIWRWGRSDSTPEGRAGLLAWLSVATRRRSSWVERSRRKKVGSVRTSQWKSTKTDQCWESAPEHLFSHSTQFQKVRESWKQFYLTHCM